MRRPRRRHGGAVFRRGAALFLVLPRHRLWRHAAVADNGAGAGLDRTITVRFDANVAPGLPWRFEPEQRTVDVKLGEVVTVYYTVTNEAARDHRGQAVFNVSPPTTGSYFTKIHCFCFTEQTLKPGEKREMPVTFFVDPKIAEDPSRTTYDDHAVLHVLSGARSGPGGAESRAAEVRPHLADRAGA